MVATDIITGESRSAAERRLGPRGALFVSSRSVKGPAIYVSEGDIRLDTNKHSDLFNR